jgi:hypothetical protein
MKYPIVQDEIFPGTSSGVEKKLRLRRGRGRGCAVER